jgi:hypothetical protein
MNNTFGALIRKAFSNLIPEMFKPYILNLWRMFIFVPLIIRGFLIGRKWGTLAFVTSSLDFSKGKPVADSMNPLETYFDSQTDGRGIWKWRHYFKIYHRHFSKFIGKDVRILEVGIYSGGSLEMWKEYFGPKCVVYGIDIEEACKSFEDGSVRIYPGLCRKNRCKST